MLVPKLLTTLRGYDRHQFIRDLTAGVIVGIVALPLAIAFAIASGVTPDRGLWTAIVAGFLISALGGSRVQIGGPTGAFVVIVYGIVQKYGIDGLTVATLMAGVILIIMGLARARQRDQVHSASRDHRLHERHRRDHLLEPDQGFVRPEDGRGAGGVPRRNGPRSSQHAIVHHAGGDRRRVRSRWRSSSSGRS